MNPDVRINFRNRNSIPGAIWDANNVLMNPDEIMPEDYNDNSLEEEIHAILAHKEYLGAKYPKYINDGKIDWENFAADKDLMVCSNFANMRVSEHVVGETLIQYSRNARVIGNCEDYKLISKINDAELVKGVIGMLGEVTNVINRKHYYTPRILRYLPHRATLDYKSANIIKYAG